MKKAALLMFVFALTIPCCTSSQDTRLIGKYVCRATGDVMELSKDHTGTVDSMGFHYTGKWSASKSEIRIEAGPVVLTGSFDGRNIAAEDAVMHNKYTFERVAETTR